MPHAVPQVWEGKGVVASARKLIGATNPLVSEPGTIRGDFAIEVGRNVIHGSDSEENGEREAGEQVHRRLGEGGMHRLCRRRPSTPHKCSPCLAVGCHHLSCKLVKCAHACEQTLLQLIVAS